ncbi:MAG: metallophosphoesterase [Tetrasphaera sp.]
MPAIVPTFSVVLAPSQSGRRRVLALLAAAAVTVPAAAAQPAGASTACDPLTQPVHQVVNPTSAASLLTPSRAEADTFAATKGFTVDNGTVFRAAATRSGTMVRIHRMFNPTTGDYHTVRAKFVPTWVAKGYRDQGKRFFALDAARGCGVAVHTYAKGTKTRQVVTAAARDQLVAAGWSYQGIAYYAAAVTPPSDDPDADGRFSIAVIPDSQQEVFGTDTRFPQRTQWLVDNRGPLDLRFVGHTGDVVNWGWLVPSQFAIASQAAAVLDQAGMPYAWALGNHDTRAVGHDGVPGSRGYGGSAYVNNPECVERFSPAECNTLLLVRHTEEYNAVFTAGRYTSVTGAFEDGKVDNIYSTFTAAGRNWMVLTLELWPRTEVVAWARDVVAAHPDTNVLVQTHSYLTSTGAISQDNGGYGANTPQYVFDNLIKLYPNIKAVFSGHVGSSAQRTDTGVHGNKIVSYLGTFHSATTNPVRLVEFDVLSGTITTKVVAPYTGQTVVAPSTVGGMSFP